MIYFLHAIAGSEGLVLGRSTLRNNVDIWLQIHTIESFMITAPQKKRHPSFKDQSPQSLMPNMSVIPKAGPNVKKSPFCEPMTYFKTLQKPSMKIANFLPHYYKNLGSLIQDDASAIQRLFTPMRDTKFCSMSSLYPIVYPRYVCPSVKIRI